MAGEVQFSYIRGRSCYFVFRNKTSGYIWSTSGGVGGFEAFTSGNWADYDIAVVEQGVSAYYVGNFPAALAPGNYDVVGKEQLGGSPAQTDPTVAVGEVPWNGAASFQYSDLATSGQVGRYFPLPIARGVAISGFMFKMVSAADHITPFTSGVISGQINRDGALNWLPLQSGAFTELGNGYYKVNLTSGDVNANTIALIFTGNQISGGPADQRDFTFVTQKG